ncbi:hypothetical protein KP509_03G072300 [Ceratopteris richardii]|uniref:Uncharacterized protein n=1 Tax=Ceratopteris richardii TaxID=49495 RepID=A0A8T2VCJ1_CERRI|nr:hypothetical protein KP509_03G072300 [Ceratopteris richardii]
MDTVDIGTSRGCELKHSSFIWFRARTSSGCSRCCSLCLQTHVHFACELCRRSPSSTAHRKVPKELTVVGLRTDVHAWEKCIIANDRLEMIYAPPPRWKRLLRRFRARAHQADCWNSCQRQQPRHENFYYDPVSYALNFDDTSLCPLHKRHQARCPHGSTFVHLETCDADQIQIG